MSGDVFKRDYSCMLGMRFRRLVVTDVVRVPGKHGVYCVCDCDCGKKNVYKRMQFLRDGSTGSCGCMRTAGGIAQEKLESAKKYIGRTFNNLHIDDVKADERGLVAVCTCHACGKTGAERLLRMVVRGVDRT